MNIEEFEMADAEGVYGVYREWDIPDLVSFEVFCESFVRIQKEPLNKVFVAKENNRVVGYVQVFRLLELGFPVSFEVLALIVEESERSKGTGALLLKRAEEYAKENGGTGIILSSQLHRSRAHVFYESHGYNCCRMSKFYEKKI